MISLQFDPDKYVENLVEDLVKTLYSNAGFSSKALVVLKRSACLEYINEYYKITSIDHLQEIDAKVKQYAKELFTINNPFPTSRTLPNIYPGPTTILPLVDKPYPPYTLISSPRSAYETLDVTYSRP